MDAWKRLAVGLAATAMLGTDAMAQEPAPPAEATEEADEEQKKEPQAGDFDAGGTVRLPNGPDEMGEYATFNWVRVDAVGRYYLLSWAWVSGTFPLAIIKPDTLVTGQEPAMIGGAKMDLNVRLPKPPFQYGDYEVKADLILSGAYMREGAMLLSDKDFPLFTGDFQPGFAGGLDTRIRLSSVIDFQLAPAWVYQSGTDDSLTAVKIPMSTIVALGELVKVSADAGIFTGDDYSFSGDDGGRIALGGALDVKLGPIIAHAGAGVASLLTGGAYPTIRDSFYIDLNVKYAK